MSITYRSPIFYIVFYLLVIVAGCAIKPPGVPSDKFYYTLATKAHKDGNYNSALEHINKAIQIDPNYPLYYLTQSRIFKSLGQNSQAEKSLLKYDSIGKHAKGLRPAPVKQEEYEDSFKEVIEPTADIIAINKDAEKKWSRWQKEMEEMFVSIESSDNDKTISSAQKTENWRAFINRFHEDNPYSENDSSLRNAAMMKIGEMKKPPQPTNQQFSIQTTLTIPSDDTRQRIALVIGNSNYKYISPLKNPENDARSMAKTLKLCRFDVDLALNTSRRELASSIHGFFEKLKKSPGSVGMFYYAGHGFEIDGNNYLVPVNAEIKRKFDVDVECYKMSAVLDAMEQSKSNLNIIVLDACRSNPFRGFRSASRGLAIMNAPMGSILVYSTAPGKVAEDGDGNNSLFTTMFLKYMMKSELNIEQILKNVRLEVSRSTYGQQVPWESSSMIGDFYFRK